MNESEAVTTGVSMPDSHWVQFEPAQSWQHYTIAGFLITLTVLAVTGNCLVIWILSKFRAIRGPERFLFINLALVDLLAALGNFPLYITSSFPRRWPFSLQACHFYAGLCGTCTLVTINTMTAIGIDRYLVLAKFKRGHWHNKNKNILIVLFVTWIPAIFWNSAPVFGWGGFMLEGYGTTCTYNYLSQKISNKTYLSAMVLTEFMLPVTIIALVYRSIYISVKNNEKVLGKSSDKLQQKVKAGQKYKRRLSEVKVGTTVALAFSVFFVSWIPNICITLLGLFNNRKAITPLSSTVAGLVAKSWSVYSPFIYTMNLPAFRKSLINTIIVKRCHFKIAYLKSYCKLKSHPCCTVYRSNKSNAYKMSTFEAQNNDRGHIIVSMFPVCPNCKQKLHPRSVTWQKVHNPKP